MAEVFSFKVQLPPHVLPNESIKFEKMRNTTKLKKILEHHIVGLSMSDDQWEISIINSQTKTRIQVSGKSYSEIIRKAFDAVREKVKSKKSKVKNADG